MIHFVRSSYAVLTASVAVIVLWACIVTAPLEALASAALMLWFSVPGFVLARLRGGDTELGGRLPWYAAGLALTLVSIACIGLAVRSFQPAWVLLVPALLAAFFFLTLHRSITPTNLREPLPVSEATCLVVATIAGLALATPAWLRAGAVLEAGVSFQPFFNADFFKHLGVANGFALGDFPPADLFGAGGTVNYYWLQHLIAGSLLALMPDKLDPVKLLLAIGMWQTAAFGALLYLWARRYAGPTVCAGIVVLALASLSLDGLASLLLADQWWQGMQQINMEALDLGAALGWTPHYLDASTLYRLALYIPQHQLCAIFFAAWALLAGSGQNSIARRCARMSLIAAMPATSVLLGVPAIAAAALCSVVSAFRNRSPVDAAPELLAIPVALIFPIATEMVVPGASALGMATTSALYEPGLLSRLIFLPFHLFTSIGVLFPAGIAGAIMLARHTDGRAGQWIPALSVLTACLAYVAAEAVLPYNRLRVDTELKLSFLLAIGLVPTAAYMVANVARERRALVAITASLLIMLGVPSVVHDTVWHSCRGPACIEGRRATTIPHDDWQALQWIRHNTDMRAVFQQSPQPDYLAGGRDVWIPVFAGRALYASRRASSMSSESIKEMRRLFDPKDIVLPSERASSHHIDYLYLSRHLEGRDFDALYARYESDLGLERVYCNGGVVIWHVRKDARGDTGT